jgi:hypothetical protein
MFWRRKQLRTVQKALSHRVYYRAGFLELQYVSFNSFFAGVVDIVSLATTPGGLPRTMSMAANLPTGYSKGCFATSYGHYNKVSSCGALIYILSYN